MVNLESFFESWIGIWMYKFVIFKVEILSFWTFPNFFQNKNNLMKTLARSFVCCATQWTIPCHFRQVLLPSARCLWVAGPKSWPSRELWSSSNTQLGWTKHLRDSRWVGGLLVGFCHSYQRLSKWDSEWNDGMISFFAKVLHIKLMLATSLIFLFFFWGVLIPFFRTWFPVLPRFNLRVTFRRWTTPRGLQAISRMPASWVCQTATSRLLPARKKRNWQLRSPMGAWLWWPSSVCSSKTDWQVRFAGQKHKMKDCTTKTNDVLLMNWWWII